MAVRTTSIPDYRGEESWQIETGSCTYIFHRRSGGLASLVDPEGKEWIGFTQTAGSAGEYRGIPNLGRSEGGFHPGRPGCVSQLKQARDDRAVIQVDSEDRAWKTLWVFTETHLEIVVNAVGHPHWFLYEGAPGGAYDESRCYGYSCDGARWRCDERWERRLPEPRWVYFQPEDSRRILFLQDAGARPADTVDSYWSMEGNMTVFGFGRLMDHRSPRWMHLNEVPSRFYVSLQEAPEQEGVPRHIPEPTHID